MSSDISSTSMCLGVSRVSQWSRVASDGIRSVPSLVRKRFVYIRGESSTDRSSVGQRSTAIAFRAVN